MIDARAFDLLRKNGANPVMAVGVLPNGAWQTVTDVALKGYLSDPAVRKNVVAAFAECLDRFVAETGTQATVDNPKPTGGITV